nr:hypothetical protein [Bradyrhizobium sp.]
MPATSRPQKITFGEMRESGIDRILIYCADYKCSHSIQMSADRWPDRSVATPTGKPWSAMTVIRARDRLAAAA